MGLLSPTFCLQSSILPWRSLRLGERTRLGCGRRPLHSVRTFRDGLLVFMQHTGVVKRLSTWRASVTFEGASGKIGKGVLVTPDFALHTSHSAGGRLCETKPIRELDSLYCAREGIQGVSHRHATFEIPDTRDKKITPYGVTTNGTWTCETNPIRRRRSGRQVLSGKRVMVDADWRRRWENEANSPPAPRVPRRIGFVWHNRPCHRVPAAPASLRTGICL
jgi:hypothetical protein